MHVTLNTISAQGFEKQKWGSRNRCVCVFHNHRGRFLCPTFGQNVGFFSLAVIFSKFLDGIKENGVVSGLPGAFYSVCWLGVVLYWNSKRSKLHGLALSLKGSRGVRAKPPAIQLYKLRPVNLRCTRECLTHLLPYLTSTS